MMREAGDWNPETRFQEAAMHFLDEMFPKMEERGQFAELFGRFEDDKIEGAASP